MASVLLHFFFSIEHGMGVIVFYRSFKISMSVKKELRDMIFIHSI